MEDEDMATQIPCHTENNQSNSIEKTESVSTALHDTDLAKEIALIQLHQSTRFLFESFKVCDVVMVNTKIVVVDARVPLHIVIRSFFEYNKSIAIVYDETLHTVAGCLDVSELMDYALYLYDYFKKTTQRMVSKPEEKGVDTVLVEVSSTNESTSLLSASGSTPSLPPVSTITPSKESLLTLASSPSQRLESGLSTLPPSEKLPPLTPLTTLSPYKMPQVEVTGFEASIQPVGKSSAMASHPASSTLLPPATIPPPWDYTVEQWRSVYTRKRPNEYICGKQTTLAAMNLLLQSSVSYLIVWNEERSAPLSFLSSINLLALLVQNLRGNFIQFDQNVKKHLKIGTYEGIVTIPSTGTISEAIHLLRTNQISSIPIIETDGTYIGCFSENHFLQLLFKSFTENFLIQSNLPILQLWEMVNQPVSIPSAPTSPISSDVPSHNYPPRRVGTEPVAAVSTQHGGTYPSTATVPTYTQQAMPNPAIAVRDITLREAILQVLQCDEHRVILTDEKHCVTGVVTATDLCRYLVGYVIQMASHHAEAIQKEIEAQSMRQSSMTIENGNSSTQVAHPSNK